MIDLGTSRRYFIFSGNGNTWPLVLSIVFTYHSITYSMAGDISDSNGGTVTIDLHRADTAEKVKTTSRVGNGSYSFTWYDNTEEMYVTAREDDTYKGRSANGLAT